jgi:hypothetical protein
MVRQIGSMTGALNHDLPDTGPVELDSHADTCCAGSNCVVLEYSSKSCNVIGFNRDNPSDQLLNVPIVKAVTAYNAPTGQTFIIVIPQALYLGDLITYSLLCPNQLRQYGIIVDDVPRHLAPDPSKATHSIYIANNDVHIPLQMGGVISLFYTRRPTIPEIEDCLWLVLTSKLDWDPHFSDFQELENIEHDAQYHHVPCAERNILSASTIPMSPEDSDYHLLQVSPIYNDRYIMNVMSVANTQSGNRSYTVTKEYLSNLWNIGVNTAAQTLQVMPQKGIRNAVHPIMRRFATKQTRLRYDQLASRHGRFYSDTFFSDYRSTRGNTMAQLFTNDCKFLRGFPMRKKSEAANALLEFIQDVGVPAGMHCDGALELQYGKWKEICQDYGIKQTCTEPHSPWQNRAEVNIREVKKYIQQLMDRTNMSKQLWDYCACYAAEIMSLTANDLYVLHLRVRGFWMVRSGLLL